MFAPPILFCGFIETIAVAASKSQKGRTVQGGSDARTKGKIDECCGAGSGIGAGSAIRLAEEGAAVIVGDVNFENATKVAAGIAAAGGRAVAVQFDITSEASVAALIAVAVAEFGGLDAIHINACDMKAILQDSDALGLSMEIYDRTMSVNMRGHLLCTRAALPEILKRGGGSIVYTSSGAAFVGEPERVAYAMTKSGLNALMRHVASRWGQQGIRANAIAPGLVITENTMVSMSTDERAHLLKVGRSHRLGAPSDIAAMVAMLISDDGEWINGQVVSVDGGITMR